MPRICADRDDAGAADAGDERCRTALERRQLPAPAARDIAVGASLRRASPFFSWPPSTVTKLGQKPFTQEKSLLQDDWLICALAAELGLERLDRQAVRLHAAVAAAFAHELVDHDALGRIGILAALAAAALFGGAGLVVDQRP